MKQPYNTTIYNTALYLRLSRDDELQGESGSIQTQRMMLRQYAAEHGLTVVDEYIDDGWSGTNFDRPSFQRMIDDIEDGKINCVVTKDLSRLGRNYILTGQYTEIYFPSKGVRYIAINDNVDLRLTFIPIPFIHTYDFTALQRYSTIGEEIRRICKYHVELEIKLFEKFETVAMSKDKVPFFRLIICF